MTWCHVKNQTLIDGAHSSIVNAQAQNDIVKDMRFIDYIDKKIL